ncbi:Ddb1-and cul4-associated factor 7 [Dirofilaria immitis]|nr:Ddb1-and cul4-associated factor 7 [Dirofilaria immitis]
MFTLLPPFVHPQSNETTLNLYDEHSASITQALKLMFYGFGQMVATSSANSSSLASTTNAQQTLQQQITTSHHQIASSTTTSLATNTAISRPSGPSSIESVPPPTPTIAASVPPAPPKRRQIYRFTSSRPLFAAGWSNKTDSEGGGALLLVSVIQLDEQQGELVERLSFEHTFPELYSMDSRYGLFCT